MYKLQKLNTRRKDVKKKKRISWVLQNQHVLTYVLPQRICIDVEMFYPALNNYKKKVKEIEVFFLPFWIIKINTY